MQFTLLLVSLNGIGLGFFLEKRFTALFLQNKAQSLAEQVQHFFTAACPLEQMTTTQQVHYQLLQKGLPSTNDIGPSAETSATPCCAVVEADLPGDGSESGTFTSRELDRCEVAWFDPSKASGRFSLAFRVTRMWSSDSNSPPEKRICQFCNMFTILLISSFSPSQVLS